MKYECGDCGNSSNVLFIDLALALKFKGKSDFGVTPLGEIYCLKCDSRNVIVEMIQEELSCIKKVKK